MVLPFAHEDLAIILGGYIIANNLMPTSLVVASIYGGIVASDFALYGIGAAARYVPWLSRYAVDGRVRRVSDTLKRNVFGLVALCRVVPGVVFVAFVACGWARVSFIRFAASSLLVSALYLPLMLYLVIMFGDALDDRIGLWAWPLLFVAIGATSFARKRIFAFRDPIEVEIAQETALPNSCFGMPPLSRADRKVAMAERIAIGADMTAGELHDRLARLGADLMLRALGGLERGALTLTPQAETGVTYASKIDKNETRIDWKKSWKEVHDHVRGLSPFPGAWFEMAGARIKVLRTTRGEGSGAPGKVLDEKLTVACGDGAVRILELQRAGARAMKADEFLRGAPIQAEQMLN